MENFSFTLVKDHESAYFVDTRSDLASAVLRFEYRKASTDAWTALSAAVLTPENTGLNIKIPKTAANSTLAPSEYRITSNGTPVVAGTLELFIGLDDDLAILPGGGTVAQFMTQTEYDALAAKDDTTIYIIRGLDPTKADRVYYGTVLLISNVTAEPTPTDPVAPTPAPTDVPAPGGTVAYIAPTASGTGDGTSVTNAAAGIASIPTLIGRGAQDIRVIADRGVYTKNSITLLPKGGTATQHVFIRGVAGDGATPQQAIFRGTDRPRPWTKGAAQGGVQFRLTTGNTGYMVFQDLKFEDMNNAVELAVPMTNIFVKNVDCINIRRLVDNTTIDPLVPANIKNTYIVNTSVKGFSKSAVRMRYDSEGITIKNFFYDSEKQDGDNFAMAIHIDGTAHNVVIEDGVAANCVDIINHLDPTTEYFNGDGVAVEEDCYNVRIRRVDAYGSTDGGFDIKATDTIMEECRAWNNKRNIRFHRPKGFQMLNCKAWDSINYGGRGAPASGVWLSVGTSVVSTGGVFYDTLNANGIFQFEETSRLELKGGAIYTKPQAVIDFGAEPYTFTKDAAVIIDTTGAGPGGGGGTTPTIALQSFAPSTASISAPINDAGWLKFASDQSQWAISDWTSGEDVGSPRRYRFQVRWDALDTATQRWAAVAFGCPTNVSFHDGLAAATAPANSDQGAGYKFAVRQNGGMYLEKFDAGTASLMTTELGANSALAITAVGTIEEIEVGIDENGFPYGIRYSPNGTITTLKSNTADTTYRGPFIHTGKHGISGSIVSFKATAAVFDGIVPSGDTPVSGTISMTRRVNGVNGKTSVRVTNTTSVRMVIGTNTDVTTGIVRTAAVTPDARGDAKLDWGILALTPGATYYYRIEALQSDGVTWVADNSTIVGRLIIPPTAATTFSFTFSSCHKDADQRGMNAVGDVGDPLFLHLGDQWYADGSGVNLDNFMNRMHNAWARSSYQRMAPRTMVSVVQSDHCGGMNNNYYGEGDPNATAYYNQAHRKILGTDPDINAESTGIGIGHTFTWGRVRFIAADQRSFMSNPSGTPYESRTKLGSKQLNWVLNTIANSPQKIIFYVSDVVWIKPPTTSGTDGWGGYDYERQRIITAAANAGKQLIVLSGDTHALAYSSGTTETGNIPNFLGGPLGNVSSSKSTTWNAQYPEVDGTLVFQYGRVTINDTGGTSIGVTFKGYSSDGTERMTYTLTVPL